jgi:uncharacterized protein YdiU (UPF0061 family)
MDPDTMVSEPVAISTRVAPSFLRVGQLELFARRARKQAHPHALQELVMIVLHLIEREYADVIDNAQSLAEKVVLLADAFRDRLTSLVANWIRVGYCQGNFNSDNCAAGGFTLDYGPFGFCEQFDPQYQPWTGGGQHFSFLNQPAAAERNYHMFWTALRPLLAADEAALQQLDDIRSGFATVMQAKLEAMWAAKLGLEHFNKELLNELGGLMVQTPVDYTILFRELSNLPDDISSLKKSFYKGAVYQADPETMDQRWSAWLAKWNTLIDSQSGSRDEIAQQMKRVNPKYSWREWFVVPAYQLASVGNYALVRELQEVMTQPYAEQSKEVEEKDYRRKPSERSELGGVSHYSCSA